MELTNFLNNEDGEKEVSPIIGNSYITTLTVLLNLYEFDELIWEALFKVGGIPLLFNNAIRAFIMDRSTILGEIPGIEYLTDEQRQEFLNHLAEIEAVFWHEKFLDRVAYDAVEFLKECVERIPLEIQGSGPGLFGLWKNAQGIKDPVDTDSVDEYDSPDAA